MAHAQLVAFVEAALKAGEPRDAVRRALEQAGWSNEQVADALAHYADVPFAVPVPRPRAAVSARDAFWYLLMFGALYVSAIYFGDLLFGFINLAFPDDLTFADRTQFIERGIRWATAALIVAFPLFLFTTWKIGKEVAADATRRNGAAAVRGLRHVRSPVAARARGRLLGSRRGASLLLVQRAGESALKHFRSANLKLCRTAAARVGTTMNRQASRAISVLSLLVFVQGCGGPPASSASASASPPPDPLVFDTWVPGPCSPNGQSQGQCPPGELFRVRLVPVAEGLSSPRHVAFTPDGDMLVVELAGRVRVVRDGTLLPEPLAGWPAEGIDAGALQAVVVHPQFAANRFVYLYYVKSEPDARTTLALARARLDGSALVEAREIFETDAWVQGGPIAGRAAFGPDGMIYLTINDHDPHNPTDDASIRIFAQRLDSDVGKILRLRDDGGIPAGNPFVGREDANPQIFTYGHRNATDFAWHPVTGELWATEIGPMGGDEINILRAGANYGWPLVSLGKLYAKASNVSEQHWYREGMEMPVMHWTPSISPNSLVWYTGDKLLPWRGHLFVGALNGQTLQRVAFDQPAPQAERRDSLFMSLGRRWRHVEQGPDGYLYAVTDRRTLGTPPDPTDATSGVVYRIEPAE